MRLKPLLPKPGPVERYLQMMPEPQQRSWRAFVQQLLSSDEGVKLMELLEYSVEGEGQQTTENVRALTDKEAQRILLRDLKRIASTNDAYLPTRVPRPAPRGGN